MKRIILLTLIVMTGSMIIWSQVPQAMNYKAVAKDDWGVALPNKAITLRFTILKDSETGSMVYQETHATVTNKFGLMDVEIGKGTPTLSTFDQIDWSNGVYFIQIEMDPNGGTNFRLEDTPHQLLSVPYALFAGNQSGCNFNDLANKPTTLAGYGITDFTFESPVTIGTKGVKISEIIEITGTTSSENNMNYTVVYYPEGYSKYNSRILSLEIGWVQSPGEYVWCPLGFNFVGTTGNYPITAEIGWEDRMYIVYPHYNNYFRAAPYRILLMKVE